MKIFDKFTWSVLTYLVSVITVGTLTFLSWLLASAHDEGNVTSVSTLGTWVFEMLRFPTHPLFQGLGVNDYFVDGLVINIFVNSAFVTWIVVTVMAKKGKFKASQ